MRLSREIVAIRESFVQDLFKADPTMTGPKAAEAVKVQFGKSMKLSRIYALRKIAAGPVATDTAPVVVAPTKAPVSNAEITALGSELTRVEARCVANPLFRKVVSK